MKRRGAIPGNAAGTAARFHDNDALDSMGWLTAGIVSLLLVLVARRQLGKSFAVTPQARDLVTHGLYSRLQNPMYVFVDLIVCAIALALERWYVLLLLVILLPLQIRNVVRERKVLREKFGERYESYRRSTWF